MSEDYKKYLSELKLSDIKNIARSYISHVKFSYSNAKKSDVINHLLSHTKRENGVIKVIETRIGTSFTKIPKSKVINLINKDTTSKNEKSIIEKGIARNIGAVKGKIFKLETERDEKVKIDADNLRKKYTNDIKKYNDELNELYIDRKELSSLRSKIKK
jgi:hypothetical protein